MIINEKITKFIAINQSMTHTLKIIVPDDLYETLKKYKLLNVATHSAIEGLINSVILKINEPRRKFN